MAEVLNFLILPLCVFIIISFFRMSRLKVLGLIAEACRWQKYNLVASFLLLAYFGGRGIALGSVLDGILALLLAWSIYRGYRDLRLMEQLAAKPPEDDKPDDGGSDQDK